MPIRSQLVILVLAVIAPVAVLAAMATVGLWELQRNAYQQRFLERVSALRIALDTEIDSTLRQLRSVSESFGTQNESAEVTFRAQGERLLANFPAWSMVGLLGADGAAITRVDRRPALAAVRFDPALFAEIAATPQAVISNLVAIAGEPGAYLTYVALPVTRDGVFRGVVYIGIEASAWHDFFKRYPIHERATLTLNDRDGLIIARTLNNEKWAGHRSTDQFLRHTIGRDEGAMLVFGVDGERYYSAFSRSRTAGWLVSTGVPRDHVEAALSRPTLLILFSVFAAAGMATLFAYILGGRITGALTALANSVESVAAGERRLPKEPLLIEEAETVRRALIAGSRLLAARETSLHGALAREAKSRAAAELASRAKDDLLAMLGHELRNPLNAIKAAVSVLEMPDVKPEVADRARAVVQRQIGHLTSIIDDLLDVAHLDSGKAQLKHQTLDLAVVTRHVVEAFTATGRCRNLQMQVDLNEEAWVVGDETRLEQVVSNLLDNACKYTPAGGAVEIAVHVEGDAAVLTIRDSGSGIPPDVLPKIFDLFSQGARTLDRSQGGLGLGLTVVRRLVDLHGGMIAANSEGLDRGATFQVRLPLTSAPIKVSAQSVQPATAPLSIVVVEDNPDNRQLVGEMLRMHGHRVVEAEDGISGVDAILVDGVDLAIVDIGLPGWDGYEVARRVRAAPAGARLRLVALTGYGRDEDKALARAAGFDLFLIKPFDIEKFLAALGQLQRSAASGPPSA